MDDPLMAQSKDCGSQVRQEEMTVGYNGEDFDGDAENFEGAHFDDGHFVANSDAEVLVNKELVYASALDGYEEGDNYEDDQNSDDERSFGEGDGERERDDCDDEENEQNSEDEMVLKPELLCEFKQEFDEHDGDDLVARNGGLGDRRSRSFQCSVCNKIFTRNDALKKHVLAVHENFKPFQFEFCEKSFIDNSSLKRHLTTHGQKPYHCDYCEKNFNQSDALKKHVEASHDTAKELICSFCQKVFDRRFALKAHIQAVHERLTPFKCELCDRAFALRGYLQKHILSKHKKSNSYHCSFCEKTFNIKGSLDRHILSVHAKLRFVKRPRVNLPTYLQCD